ncbi:MAG: hypothetical protein JSU01_16235 [Bacteroidetes bacterium]|nr:hypothetical protein [Bacteroidota bacterium]
MKIHKSTSTSKLVARFDNQLKKMLLKEIKTFRGVNTQFLTSNNQARLTV